MTHCPASGISLGQDLTLALLIADSKRLTKKNQDVTHEHKRHI